MTENDEQALLFEWAGYMTGKHPELALLYSVPNGGYRHIATAVMLKKTGTKPGTPDICLPIPRGGYGALYIEMKKKTGGRLSINQKMCINALNDAGNKAVVCMGFDQAWEAILNYLEGGER